MTVKTSGQRHHIIPIERSRWSRTKYVIWTLSQGKCLGKHGNSREKICLMWTMPTCNGDSSRHNHTYKNLTFLHGHCDNFVHRSQVWIEPVCGLCLSVENAQVLLYHGLKLKIARITPPRIFMTRPKITVTTQNLRLSLFFFQASFHR